jgi:hypothetical protein
MFFSVIFMPQRLFALFNVLFVFVLAPSAFAELYKSVDEHGNVTYTDKSSASGAKPVEPPDLTSYKPPPQHTRGTASAPSEATSKPSRTVAYSMLSIVAPAHDTTVRQNAGDVIIRASLSPALDAQSGHKLVALLDGNAVGESSSNEITLRNVDRGTHTLKLQIIDASGRVLKASEAVSFHLRRSSAAGR